MSVVHPNMLMLLKAVSSRHHEPSIGDGCVRKDCSENSKACLVRNNYDSGAANDVPFENSKTSVIKNNYYGGSTIDVPFENSKTSVIKNNYDAVVYHPLRYIVVLGPDY